MSIGHTRHDLMPHLASPRVFRRKKAKSTQREIKSVTLTGRLTKEPKLYQPGKAVYALLGVPVHAGKG